MDAFLSLVLLLGQIPMPFGIRVIDEQTERGIPMVELRTVHQLRFYTDSQGYAAISEPELNGREIHFTIFSPGYEFPKDGFGFHGKTLKVVPGETVTLRMKRTQWAQRLYRLTGAGIYSDSERLGVPRPLNLPAVNSGVFGSDSVLNVEYRGRTFWVWGDTHRPSYPLGNFQVTGATSEPFAKIDPDVGIAFRYLEDGKGFVKQLAPIPGDGPTWIESLVVLPDEKKQPRLYCSYVKVKPPLEIYARGLAVFDDDQQKFVSVRSIPLDAPLFPKGHHLIDQGYLYLGNPFPTFRVPAEGTAYLNREAYEGFTCIDPVTGKIDRDTHGGVRYQWRKQAKPLLPDDEARLIRSGELPVSAARMHLMHEGKFVSAHGGSIAWNEYRRKYLALFTQHSGKASFLGEVWLAEADDLTGPWSKPHPVATHPKMSFYNPKQHPELARQGGRMIYFEGTYCNTFSGNPDQTPRYDYNQLMYRIDLGEPRLPESKSRQLKSPTGKE